MLLDDMTGQQFGRLTVLREGPRSNGKARSRRWICRCTCGTERLVLGVSLRFGLTTSCGCYRREALVAARTTHGHTRDYGATPEHKTWSCMRARCTNPRRPDFKRYGGRGIRVCDRWRDSFEAFLADMGPRPSPRHSLDRFPNNDGDYEPGNCRWATREEQARNTRSNVWIEFRGERLIIGDWVRRLGIPYRVLHYRLVDRGWSVERAFTTPPRRLPPRGRRSHDAALTAA